MVDILDSVAEYLANDNVFVNNNNNNDNDAINNNNNNHDIWELPPSLWNKIKNMSKQVEWDEIKLVISDTIIENNILLHEEIRSLTILLRNLQKQNQNCDNYTSISINGDTKQHELLRTEISSLVNLLNGLNHSPTPQTSREKAVLNYAISNTSCNYSNVCSSRPTSSRQRPSRPSTATTPSRSSSCMSTYSCNSNWDQQQRTLMDLGHKINALDIHEVVHEIRQAFENERNYLLDWIKQLYECLEVEHSEVILYEEQLDKPSVKELQEFGNKLRSQWQEQQLQKEKLKMLSKLPSASKRGIQLKSLNSLPQIRPPPPRTNLKPIISPITKRRHFYRAS